MPVDEIRTLRALPDGSIFLSGQSGAPFRFVPGLPGEQKDGTWINYRGQAEATPQANLLPLTDLSLAPLLAPVRSADGRWRLCKVWRSSGTRG